MTRFRHDLLYAHNKPECEYPFRTTSQVACGESLDVFLMLLKDFNKTFFGIIYSYVWALLAESYT